MGTVTTEILIILLLLLANGLFALSEIAIVSARKSRLQQQAEEGDQGAAAALALSESPTRFLSTVQVGITLIGILSGAFGGATLAEQIAAAVSAVPVLVPYSEAIGIVVVVLSITYLSLVIGELVPKRIAMGDPEGYARRVAPLMQTLSRIVQPLVRLLSLSTEAVLRLLPLKPSGEPLVTTEDVRMMIFEGTRLGVFDPVEQEIVERVFRLGDRPVSTMMTYRTDLAWLDVEDPLLENLIEIVDSGYSRYPVCKGSLEAVLGVVQVKDLFAQVQSGQEIDLHSGLLPALFLPEAMSGLQVLARFRQERQHIGLVVDEFGGIVGLVTLNDVLDSIVGDVPEVDEEDEPVIVRREDGSLLLDGLLSIGELKNVLQVAELPGEQGRNYETLGGLVMEQLGRIPISGDHFVWDHFRFEVVDMDGYRVDKVLVQSQV